MQKYTTIATNLRHLIMFHRHRDHIQEYDDRDRYVKVLVRD